MFEGSLVESRGLVGTGTARWTALGSAALQFGLAALLVTIPLLRPTALPMLLDAPKLALPAPPRPPLPRVRMEPAASSATAMSLPAASAAPVAAVQSLLPIVRGIDVGPEPAVAQGINMGPALPGALIAAIGTGGPGPNVSVAPARKIGPVTVSTGVLVGLLLTPIQPVYPAIARAARVEGTVVMEATISKTGRIESLRAVSGPEMLRRAALDAVEAARYQPYRLNGEPTEVQTTITVNFRLGS